MDPTPSAPTPPPRSPSDALRQLEVAVESMAAARTALQELERQRGLVASSSLAILILLSVITLSLTGLGSVSWLATVTLASVAVLARITIQVDIDLDSKRRSEVVEACTLHARHGAPARRG